MYVRSLLIQNSYLNQAYQRLLLILIFMLFALVGVQAQNVYTNAGLAVPTVTSDKDDYAPGEIAIITGTGWKLDSLVDIHLEEDPAHDHHHSYHDTKVNADGTWRIEYPIEERHLGTKFTVIVDGKQTGYQGLAYFTDNGPFSATISPSTGNVSASNQTYRITIKNEATSGNPQLGSFRIKLPASFGTPSDINITASGTWNLAGTNGYINGYNSTDRYIGITADKNSDRLTRQNTLTLEFKSNNPNTAGNYEFTTEATGNIGMDFSNALGTLATGASQPLVSINKLTTSLTVNSATSQFAGTTSLSAVLQSNSLPIANREIFFLLDGNSVGSAFTGVDGVATLADISVNGINVGVHANKISASFAEDGSYLSSNGSAQLTIIKAEAIITLSDLEHTYNSSPKTATATTNPAGLTGVTISYKPENADESSFTTNAPVNAGTYDVKAVLTNANYTAAPVTGTLIINKANQTIAWNNPANITYGTALSATQLNAILSAGDGALTYLTALNTVLDAGNGQTLTVTAAATTNYNQAQASVTINVLKASPVVNLTVGGPYTYDGNAKTITSAEVTGVNSTNLGSATVTYKQGETIVAAPTNAGSYEVLATFAENTNYNAAQATGTLIINKAEASFAVSDVTGKVYNGAAQPITVSTVPSGLAGVSVKYLQHSNEVQASAVVNAGDYTYEVSLDNPNYAAAPVSNSFTIAKAPSQTVITINGSSFTYTGAPIEPATVSVTGAGGLNLSPGATYSNNTNAGDATASYSFAGGANHEPSYDSKTFTIGKATLTIAASNATRIYGDQNPAFAGSIVSGNVQGESFAVTAGSAADAASGVGTYPIVPEVTGATLANYTVVKNNGTLTITERPITITADAGQTKVYGENDPATFTYQITAGNLVNNDQLSGVLARDPGNDVAAYTITQNTLAATANYTLTYVGAYFTVTPRAVTVAADAKSKVYGSVDPELTYTVSSGSVITGDNFDGELQRAPGENVNTYTVTLGSLSLGSNYTLSLAPGALFTITPKSLVASISASDKVYDGNDVASANGSVPAADVVGNDNVEVTVSNAKFDTKNAGQGKTVTANVTISNTNYSLSNTSASTTANITAKDITGSFTAANKEYDGNETANINGLSLAGVISPDEVGLTDGTATFADKNAGTGKTVTLTGASLSGADKDNYNLTSVSTTTASISRKPASVSPSANSKVYGEDDPDLQGTLNGFIAADGITANYNRAAGENVGNYAISATLNPATALTNYDITYNPASFEITKATLTATANIKTRIYGIANPVLDGVLTGVKNNDNITANYSTTAQQGSDVGPYPITVSLNDPDNKLGNYTVTKNDAVLTITQAPATIALTGLSKVYNGLEQGAVVTTSPENIAVTVTYNGAAALPKAARSYAVTAALNNSNYAAESATGTLVIAPKELTATLANPGKVYDGNTNAPGTTATLNGMISGDEVTTVITNAAFSSANAGDRTVSATVSLSGADKDNYSLGNVSIANATIAPKGITAQITAGNKMYNGNDEASATGNVPAADVIGNDIVEVTVSNARFNNKDVGTNKPVTANVAINNANYKLSTLSVATTADITPAPLTITAPSMSKYCGQADPLTDYNCNVSGAVPGEVISATYTISGTSVVPASNDPKLSNYTPTYVDGVLTINGLSLDASDASIPRSIHEDVIINVTVKDGATDIAGVTVDLMFEGVVKATAVSNASGVATFNLGKLAVNVYAVTVSAGGGSCSVSPVVYLPVYDPDGGFVTGGGWINSTAGSLVGSEATGKANFGFVAKYKKGSSQVEGNTEFQFQSGNINFKSSAHDAGTLVISGAKATYKGTGTIAGLSGTFNFMVAATDGQVYGGGGYDKFRIKIWSGGNVIYDNGKGAAENAELGDDTKLVGGSIVIHEVKSTSKGTKLEVAKAVETTEFYNYPNTFTDRTTIAFSLEKEESYILEVYDMRGSLIKKIDMGVAKAGKVYEYEFDGNNLSKGIYIARLVTPSGARSIKMLLSK
ncbi:MBG domain-containing protein [Pontibacter populi]|uniref:MBG domain-containing protein n=1 Tax=Pontibacter populi TaxID=890055 RepID=A0ABV1RVS6_9BACT